MLKIQSNVLARLSVLAERNARDALDIIECIDSKELSKYVTSYPALCILKYTSHFNVLPRLDQVGYHAFLATANLICSEEYPLNDRVIHSLGQIFQKGATPDILEYCMSALAGAFCDDSSALGQVFHNGSNVFTKIHSFLSSISQNDVWVRFVTDLSRKCEASPHKLTSFINSGIIPLDIGCMQSVSGDTMERLVDSVLAYECSCTTTIEALHAYLLQDPTGVYLLKATRPNLVTLLIQESVAQIDYTCMMCIIRPSDVKDNTYLRLPYVDGGSILHKWKTSATDCPIVKAVTVISAFTLAEEQVFLHVGLDLLRKIPTDHKVKGWNTDIAIQYCENMMISS